MCRNFTFCNSVKELQTSLWTSLGIQDLVREEGSGGSNVLYCSYICTVGLLALNTRICGVEDFNIKKILYDAELHNYAFLPYLRAKLQVNK